MGSVGMYGNEREMIVTFGMRQVKGEEEDLVDEEEAERREAVLRGLESKGDSSRGSRKGNAGRKSLRLAKQTGLAGFLMTGTQVIYLVEASCKLISILGPNTITAMASSARYRLVSSLDIV
jgi:hypothetical protein